MLPYVFTATHLSLRNQLPRSFPTDPCSGNSIRSKSSSTIKLFTTNRQEIFHVPFLHVSRTRDFSHINPGRLHRRRWPSPRENPPRPSQENEVLTPAVPVPPHASLTTKRDNKLAPTKQSRQAVTIRLAALFLSCGNACYSQ